MIDGNFPSESPSFRGRLLRIRADTQALVGRTGNLTDEFVSLQQSAYDSYNQCHSAYENAWDASTDDGNTDNSYDGQAINNDLVGLNMNQQKLQTLSSSSGGDTNDCRGELIRISEDLSGLLASTPPGPTAGALGRALRSLESAQSEQSQVDPANPELAQNQALLVSVAQDAAAIAADAPGQDVSGPARMAMNDLQTAQFG